MAYRSRYAPPKPSVGRRTSPWRIFLPTGVLLVLFAGLGGFWAYATWRVGQELDALLAREAAHGRQWDCPSRTIGGFPFRIEVSCERPSFSGAPGGVSTQGEVARFVAVAQIQSPNHVIIEVDGPLVVTDVGGRRLDLSWDLLRGSLEGRPDQLDQLALEMTNPRLKLTGTGGFDMTAEGAMVDFHMRRTPGRPPEERAYDVASRGTALRIPAVERLVGGAEPLDADLVATVLQVEPLAARTPAQNLERWRLAGGKVQVSKLVLAQGPRRLDATGILGLDELHRAQGRLDVTVAGVDDLLQQFGLSPRAATLGTIIAGVLGGRPKAGQAEAAEKPPGGVVLPLRLDDGKAFLGPLPVARLLPLY
ncbi:MAG: DUF2125 domain-containing protein [Alsobacter sp.]